MLLYLGGFSDDMGCVTPCMGDIIDFPLLLKSSSGYQKK